MNAADLQRHREFLDSTAKQFARAEMRQRNDWISRTIRADMAEHNFEFIGDNRDLCDESDMASGALQLAMPI